METHPGPEHPEHLFKHRVVQDGDPRDKKLPTGRGVGHIHRFSKTHTSTYQFSQSRKYMRFHLQGRSYQFKALPFGLSTAPMEFTVVTKEVKLMALQKGIRTHQYLDDWLVRASTHDTCLQHTQTLVTLCQELGWLVNKEKSELVPKQVFNFVGYQFDLKEGKVRPTEERWQTLTDKIRSILSDPVCPVRHFMSIIGLLTATEKQVHLGRLHMRPIQWHLKNNWRVPESQEKVIPVPKSLHPHLRWWLEESNVLLGQPLHPLKHALQIFTDASKEGWGAHLDEHTARGTKPLRAKSSVSGSKRVSNPLLQQDSTNSYRQHNSGCLYQQRGGMKLGSLCALLWRILSWCTRQQITLRARHIPGRLNVIADKLSRLGQTIQTSSRSIPSCLPPGSTTNCHSLCHWCQTPRLGQWMHSASPGRTWTHMPFHQQPSWWKSSDCPSVAQHALVLGSSGNVQSNPTVPAQHTKLGISTIQPGPSQEPVKSELTCLAPRASAIKEQGFSEAVAA